MSYFAELKQNNVSSTLWAKYSMLKSTMKINDQVDISTYASVNAMLKKESKGHIPKQARIFTENELKLFIDTAPDDLWLDVKVTKFLLFFLSAFPILTHFYKQFMFCICRSFAYSVYVVRVDLTNLRLLSWNTSSAMKICTL